MASSVDISAAPPPSLSLLVSYLLAAKRSLNCADHLSRANEIVTASRSLIVQQAVIEAKTSFLLSGCKAQTATLDQLRLQLEGVLHETSEEIAQITKGAESSGKRLDGILASLQTTLVDSKLRPQGEEPKNLLDFVEGIGVQGLLEEVWTAIGGFQQARDHFAGTTAKFQQDLNDIRTAVTECGSHGQDSDAGPLPALLQGLETSAHEMAQNFESLVKHYDLCLKALRHTEGAGAALYQAANNDLTDDQNAALAHELELGEGSVSAEDHAHMLTLLSDDAQQVEEVIDDIRLSLADMEASYASASAYIKTVKAKHAQAVAAFGLLESIGDRLAQYTTQAHLFVLRIDDEKANIADKRTQLSELTHLYSGFLSAYDKLIIEVGRRKDVARRMKRVQEEALAKLETLHREDVEERDLFKANQGEFLPMDIWPGLMAPAPRYDIVLADGDRSVPDISASVVQRAIRRVSAKPAAAEQM